MIIQKKIINIITRKTVRPAVLIFNTMLIGFIIHPFLWMFFAWGFTMKLLIAHIMWVFILKVTVGVWVKYIAGVVDWEMKNRTLLKIDATKLQASIREIGRAHV